MTLERIGRLAPTPKTHNKHASNKCIQISANNAKRPKQICGLELIFDQGRIDMVWMKFLRDMGWVIALLRKGHGYCEKKQNKGGSDHGDT